MCFGAVGDAIGDLYHSVDKALKPVGDFSQKVYDETLGWAMPKQVDQLSDWATHHPAEVGTAIGTGFAAAAYAGGAAAGAGAASSDAAPAAAGSLGAGDAAATMPADVSVGTTGAGGTTATAAATPSATSPWVAGLETAGKYVAPAVVSSLLQPKPPKTKAPTAMPDPLAQQQAQQQKLIAQMARRGRASTILTNPGSAGGSLGG